MSVVSHDFSPGKSGKSGEVPRQPLLHLGLQRAVLRASSRVAIHADAAAVVATPELGIFLEGIPQGHEWLTEKRRPGQVHIGIGYPPRCGAITTIGRRSAADAQRRSVFCDRTQIEDVLVSR